MSGKRLPAHKWTDVGDHTYARPVPGGMLYRTEVFGDSSDFGIAVAMTFVPMTDFQKTRVLKLADAVMADEEFEG
jgi:hypothetical protein